MLLNKRIPILYLIKKVQVELVIVIIYTFSIQFIDEYLEIDFLAIPISIPTLLGAAISLILTFRISQSYDRWWEARKIWGSIVNDSRSLVRQMLTFPTQGTVEGESIEAIQKRVAYRQMGWNYALGESLRGFEPLENKEQYFSEEDMAFARQHDNVPNSILLLHSRDIEKLHHAGAINDYQQMQLDATVTRLCDWMGMSERIKNTVFPKQYSLIVEFFLYLFVILLPFGILEYFSYIEASMTVLICMPFFVLEKTALHLQDPFENKPTDISVTAIANTIEVNIRQMLDEKFNREPDVKKFYVM